MHIIKIKLAKYSIVETKVTTPHPLLVDIEHVALLCVTLGFKCKIIMSRSGSSGTIMHVQVLFLAEHAKITACEKI